jgi:hypothetical protein
MSTHESNYEIAYTTTTNPADEDHVTFAVRTLADSTHHTRLLDAVQLFHDAHPNATIHRIYIN